MCYKVGLSSLEGVRGVFKGYGYRIRVGWRGRIRFFGGVRRWY